MQTSPARNTTVETAQSFRRTQPSNVWMLLRDVVEDAAGGRWRWLDMDTAAWVRSGWLWTGCLDVGTAGVRGAYI